MAIFGLGDEPKTKKPTDKKDTKKTPQAAGQSAEAKAILAKMEAKKDAGDCPFC